jgi:thiol-disulfide isomerase/thioredoxin
MSADSPASPPAGSPLRLAVGSVLLGLFGLFLSVFVLGAVPALVGLALGVAHLRRPGVPKPLGRWGVGICLCALLSSVGFAFAWRSGMEHRQAAMERFLTQLPHWRGVPAPAATFRLLDDAPLKLPDLRGAPVVITFWSSSVPPCVAAVPDLVRLRNEFPPAELAIVAVSVERPHQQQRFAAKHGINYSLCWLGRLDVPPPPFDNILAVPVTFFVDRKGIIQEVIAGGFDYATLKAKALAPDWSGPANGPPPTAIR